jgi:hypothetical protein
MTSDWISRSVRSVLGGEEAEVECDTVLVNPLASALDPINHLTKTAVVQKDGKGLGWVAKNLSALATKLVIPVSEKKANLTNVIPLYLELEVTNNLPFNILVNVPGFETSMLVNDAATSACMVSNAGKTATVVLHDARKDMEEFRKSKLVDFAARMRYEAKGKKDVAVCDVFDKTRPPRLEEAESEDEAKLRLSVHHPFVYMARHNDDVKEFIRDQLHIDLHPSGALANASNGILDYYVFPEKQFKELENKVSTIFSPKLVKKDLSPDKFSVELSRVDQRSLISLDGLVQFDSEAQYMYQIKLTYIYCPLPALSTYTVDTEKSNKEKVYLKAAK